MAIRKPKAVISVKAALEKVRKMLLAAIVLADESETTVEDVVADVSDAAVELTVATNLLKARNRQFGRDLGKEIAKARADHADAVAEAYDDGMADAEAEAERRDIEEMFAGPDQWLAALAGDGDLTTTKWESPYLRRLGALEHCDEVLALHRAEAVAKAEGRKGAVEPALVRELADLYCILRMQYLADGSFAETVKKRSEKFRPW